MPQPSIEESRFRELAAKCKSQVELCKLSGLCPATVCKFVNRYKIVFESRYPTKDQLESDLKEGLSQYKISNKYDIVPKTTRKLLKLHGLHIAVVDNSTAIRSVLSKSTKALWTNETYRINQSRQSRLKWERPEYRAKLTKHLIKIGTNQSTTMTRPHLKVTELLDSLDVKYQIEHEIGPWKFDIFIPAHNLLIEVQGTYWHGLNNIKSRDTAKSTYVKEYFPQYQLKYIWEHECLTEGSVLAKLKHWLSLDKIEQVVYDFKDVGIAMVHTKEADTFLYNWHYQHTGRHGLDIGCYINQQLIAMTRFTSPSRNEIATSLGYTQKEILELARLCVHPKHQKKNLLSWFLARAEQIVRLEKTNIKCLVSFADSTYNHTGAVYKASNWTLNRIVEPNYWYVDSFGWVMHKKTLWDQAKKMSMSETEYASKYGFTKIWGKEKYKFTKILVPSP